MAPISNSQQLTKSLEGSANSKDFPAVASTHVKFAHVCLPRLHGICKLPEASGVIVWHLSVGAFQQIVWSLEKIGRMTGISSYPTAILLFSGTYSSDFISVHPALRTRARSSHIFYSETAAGSGPSCRWFRTCLAPHMPHHVDARSSTGTQRSAQDTFLHPSTVLVSHIWSKAARHSSLQGDPNHIRDSTLLPGDAVRRGRHLLRSAVPPRAPTLLGLSVPNASPPHRAPHRFLLPRPRPTLRPAILPFHASLGPLPAPDFASQNGWAQLSESQNTRNTRDFPSLWNLEHFALAFSRRVHLCWLVLAPNIELVVPQKH